MNFLDMQEIVWRNLGYQYSATSVRKDYMVQEVRDNINASLDDVFNAHPYFWNYVRESTLTTASGTTVYTLDDFCRKVIDLYSVDANGNWGVIDLIAPSRADAMALRVANVAQGAPAAFTWYTPTTSAAASGTDGAITEGAKVLTSAAAAFTSALVGRRVKIQGRDYGHKVASVESATSLTLDRAWKGPLRGNGTTNAASNVSSANYEIGPVGRLQLELLSGTVTPSTVYYRHVIEHTHLINDEEEPSYIPTQFHSIIVDGALARGFTFKTESGNKPAQFQARFDQGLQRIRDHDGDVMFATRYQIPYETMMSKSSHGYRPGWALGYDV